MDLDCPSKSALIVTTLLTWLVLYEHGFPQRLVTPKFCCNERNPRRILSSKNLERPSTLLSWCPPKTVQNLQIIDRLREVTDPQSRGFREERPTTQSSEKLRNFPIPGSWRIYPIPGSTEATILSPRSVGTGEDRPTILRLPI